MKLSDYDLLLLSEPIYAEQRKYWLDKLSNEFTRTGLMPDNNLMVEPDSMTDDTIQRKLEFIIPQELWGIISKLTKHMEMSIYLLLLTSVKILVFLYSGDGDISIISPIYKPKRTQETLNSYVIIREQLSHDLTFKELLFRVREVALKVYENQDYPFDKILEELGVNQKEESLFGITCLLKNIHDMEKFLMIDGGITLAFGIQTQKDTHENCLNAQIIYDCTQYNEFTIQQFYQHYLRVLKQVTTNPKIQLSEITLLSREEREQILKEFNDTYTDYPRDKTLHQLFDEQLARTPDSIVAVCGTEELSYRDLGNRANLLAQVLRKKGVKTETIVGLATERSLEMLVGILAILKAGGAYLPIDPKCPMERINFMLADTQCRLLLTDGSLPDSSSFCNQDNSNNQVGFNGQGEITNQVELIAVNTLMNNNSTEVIKNINHPTDLAYIIYTSGSTGNPKGVMVEHQNVVRLVKNTNYVELKPGQRILQTGAVVFDASTFEIWGVLLNGLTLYLVDESVILDAYRLEKTLNKYQITTMWLTSTLFQQLITTNPKMFANLHNLIIGGEALSPPHVNTLLENSPYLNIINGYGPTENTTFSTFFPIKRKYKKNIPIGKPISNSTAYILDTQDRLCPIGLIGELCVGGEGVARGYLNNEDLTRKKFVPDPFKPGKKMYRSGDYARWLPDGNIEFIGRIDQQVKIRGFRIEPGEIVSNLLNYEAVQEAVVLPQVDQNGSKYLCAYLTADRELTVSELRDFLLERLPDYMIPAYFVQLESIPLTRNGKLDRKALPKPNGSMAMGVEYIPPRNEVEERMAELWAEVLGVEKVGINDSFFSLGGDSIKAIQIASRLKKYGLKMEIKDLFQHHKISELSGLIKETNITAEQGTIEGYVRLTPIQAWFFEQNYAEMHHFNQSVMLYRKEGFEVEALKVALTKIVKHHDALRMIYISESEYKVYQYNRGLQCKLFDFELFDLTGEANFAEKIEKLANQIQASIDLENGSLVKVALFKTKEGDHMLLSIHHLVVDGISWRIIFEDLAQAYQQALRGEEIQLPAKTHSFREWAEKLWVLAQGKEMKCNFEYWSQLLQLKIKPLPKDQQISYRQMEDTKVSLMILDREYTEHLLKDVNQAYNTEINDLLLTALGLTVQEWTDEECILINFEGHGREEVIEEMDITRTVGWFTSMYPMVLDLSKSSDLSYLIKSIKEDLRHVPDKGISYGILRYLTKDDSLDTRKLEVHPEISFNYLGQFDQDVKTGVFSPSKLSAGISISKKIQSNYALDINGMIVDGRLLLRFSYNEYEYCPDTIEQLVESYKKNLQRIINHCLQLEETDVTPSDLGDSSLSLEELDSIASLYEED